MITRTATARQLEELLKHTPLELVTSRSSCEQLLQERENSQKEILSALDRNKQMRSELAELHSQLMDTREERDQLQRTLDGSDRSSGALQDVLKLTADLKVKLCDADTRRGTRPDASRAECGGGSSGAPAEEPRSAALLPKKEIDF
ncbi:hypothetical protein EVAR_35686_1 [Eumeta japonica]|uniref:Uncharacterized protein n=1 Tax=Eumeta variegata TaxID=151549 RepID=A0A4C1VF54_EUMVA|nr:hypothetical protein EVAR_35686_1 [Eumeta japonica]